MFIKGIVTMKEQQRFGYIIASLLLVVLLVGCGGPSSEDLAAVDYTPLAGDDWEISTPEAEGLDPELVAELYYQAAQHETIYSLLVVKNGKLVAEDYFNEGAIYKKTQMQSVSKSYVSTLIGLALEEGCLESVDQQFLDFFPEYADQIRDPRKNEITIRQLLQMRSGYPWEESDPRYFEALLAGDNPPLIVGFPLTADPGTTFQYSTATSAWLAAIVSRACETNLKDYAEEHLLDRIGSTMGEMWRNKYNDYHAFFHFSGRDEARYGLLYLHDGVFNGEQIVPEDWVHDSLQTYSEQVSTGGPDGGKIGRYFRDIGYGYQWWSGRVGDHHFNFAYGHGGQLIVLLHDLDMVIVTTADPFWQQHDGESWRQEKAIINLVGEFIDSLPSG